MDGERRRRDDGLRGQLDRVRPNPLSLGVRHIPPASLPLVRHLVLREELHRLQAQLGAEEASAKGAARSGSGPTMARLWMSSNDVHGQAR